MFFYLFEYIHRQTKRNRIRNDYTIKPNLCHIRVYNSLTKATLFNPPFSIVTKNHTRIVVLLHAADLNE